MANIHKHIKNPKNALGKELPYKSADTCAGGPIDGEAKEGLQPGMGVKGDKTMKVVGKPPKFKA